MSLPPTATMEDVHTSWLAAGANEDVETMRQLWKQFPEWLNFQRQIESDTSDSLLERQTRFCSWSGFHLRTIGASALHTATWAESLGILEFLLEFGQNPDEGDDSGVTAVMVAILRLNLVTMRCVLRNGEAVRRTTVVDCRQEQDECVSSVIAVIKLLLKFGANVNARSQDGKTALHCSTFDDAYEVAKVLLDAGATINAVDENGRTPLHYCVHEGGLQVTDLLLSRGANIDAENKDGVSPLKLMVQRANVNTLQLFLNHHHCVVTPHRHYFAETVLFQAVDIREENLVRYIVENEYASVAARNSDGETTFHRAIFKRGSSLMKLLADFDSAGDNLTATTVNFETPAHYAVKYGSHREVETLLQCLTSVFGDLLQLGETNPLNAMNLQGMTSLYIAATTTVRSGIDPVIPWRPSEDVCLVERNLKATLLIQHGARLFPRDKLIQSISTDSSRIILPLQVQHCLRSWLVEEVWDVADEEPEDEETAHAGTDRSLVEALTQLCVQWMSGVACVGKWASLLPIFICADYAHEIVPLLVGLPVQRWALPALLRQLEKFARYQLRHRLLLQLHDELREALQTVGMLV
ncbi:hypothetical protein F441_10864 [Phytophthora nicotianae CJ01A1]|uniref:Uncharacterized protein n=5 Tax=Phytophthora nicotianae TaxID=4792 RepID=W2GPW1_PHYNI|nr:hypothetical protein L915_10682 [Phytophthora nicotianae]ETL37784.1 hypothetical protein L916_10573 [Phytophthora nicotianae]ETP14168.1 hypothetical protein F441_10864 [Phytophthora nicotianae CJ01A1]